MIDMNLYSLINGFISFIVFNLPCGTVDVGVIILSLRNGLKLGVKLAGKFVLLLRDDRVLTLVSKSKK